MSYQGKPVSSIAFPAGTFLGWVSVSKTYTDWTDVSTEKSITIYTLPVGAILLAVKAKTSEAFGGGGATKVDMRLGDGTSYSCEKGTIDAGMDVLEPVADDTFVFTSVMKAFNHGATTNVFATLNSDVPLNTLTTGIIDIWFLLMTAT